MEADQIKTETDDKPGIVRTAHKSVALTENEAGSAVVRYENGVPSELVFVTKRPAFFLPLGNSLTFRNKMSYYGWRVRAWTPAPDGRATITCGFAVRIFAKERAKPRPTPSMYK